MATTSPSVIATSASESGVSPIRLGLGIDTGGTFTDAVAVDLATGELVAKAKSPTTRDDLAVGIAGALRAIGAYGLSGVELVSLSTTLATNAVVEGKGARVGLIVAAPDPATFSLPSGLPAAEFAVIAGAHSPDGRVRTPLDLDAAASAIAGMVGRVDAFAVSAYFGVANAEHEVALRSLIAETYDAPVVCGHELSQHIGMVERATTAALNARLLPLVRDLLDAVRATLDSLGISAPLMVVKGDGSLTAESVARLRPVDTVLSGPAASVVGACRLSGLTSALVADMGGTTTDIALVSGGMPEVSAEGASVGGWRTRVHALDVRTVGLGGDSRVRIDPETAASDLSAAVRIGPDRAMPLCTGAQRFPEIRTELDRLAHGPRDAESRAGQSRDAGSRDDEPAEPVFYTLVRRPEQPASATLEALFEHLHGRAVPAVEAVRIAGPFVEIDDLVRSGHILEIAVTPTDVLAAKGGLDLGDPRASAMGLDLLAAFARTSASALTEAVSATVGRRLALEVAARALAEDLGREPSADEVRLLDHQLSTGDDGVLRNGLNLGVPLVAVGAPVAAWFPFASEHLDVDLQIPTHAEVANAFGALAGRVLERSEARVKAEPDETFAVITPTVRESHADYVSARARAEQLASDHALSAAADAGATDAQVTLTYDEVVARQARPGDDVFVELTVVATASGPPFI